MRRFHCATFAAVAVVGFASVASAADLPVKAPTYKAQAVIAPVNNWSGVYVGLNAGGAWGNSQTDFTPTGLLTAVPAWISDLTARGSSTQHPNGFTGGGQIGINWQTGNFVFGAEADFQYLGLKASTQTPTFITGGLDPYRFATSIQTDWLFTLRPRVGLAFDRALVYATGGLAVGNQKFSQTLTFDGPPNDFNTGSVSKTSTGWVVGGGLEYMVTNNWSVRGEYLYVDLGSVSYASVNTINPLVTATHNERLNVNIARAAINYRFDAGGPLWRSN
jgi:outer membrane immunogenic protein